MKKKKKMNSLMLLIILITMISSALCLTVSAQSVLAIHGQVADMNGSAIKDVKVTLNYDNSNVSTLTCDKGLFNFVLWQGITGTLTFEKKGYTFSPSSYEVKSNYDSSQIKVVAVPESVDPSKVITEISQEQCQVPVGTTAQQLKKIAPSTIKAKFLDGSEKRIDVIWLVPTNVAEYNPNLDKPGTYKVRARIYEDDYLAVNSLKDSQGKVYCYLNVKVI